MRNIIIIYIFNKKNISQIIKFSFLFIYLYIVQILINNYWYLEKKKLSMFKIRNYKMLNK